MSDLKPQTIPDNPENRESLDLARRYLDRIWDIRCKHSLKGYGKNNEYFMVGWKVQHALANYWYENKQSGRSISLDFSDPNCRRIFGSKMIVVTHGLPDDYIDIHERMAERFAEIY